MTSTSTEPGARLHSFADATATVEELASRVIRAIEHDLATEGDATLVVSGGSTPVALFGRLSQADLNWSRVTITLADERWVPADHADSNAGLVKRTLQLGAAARSAFVPLYTGHETPELGEGETTTRIRTLRRPFSVVLLGMGTDGHFASCFPNAPNLQHLLDPDSSALVRAVRPPNTKHPRITLTMRCLLQAKFIALQIHGETKRNVLESAVEQGLPAGRLIEQPIDVFWSP